MQHTIQTLNKISAGLALSLFLATPAMALKDDTNQPLNVVSKEQIADFESNKAIFIKDVVAGAILAIIISVICYGIFGGVFGLLMLPF